MAVARMKRVTVHGYLPAMAEVVERLQLASVLQVTVEEETVEGAVATISDAEQRDLARINELLGEAQFVRDFLAKYHVHDAPFASFVSEKIHVGLDEFLSLEAGTAFSELYDEVEFLAERMASADRERGVLRALISDLEPWEALPLQIAYWKGTEHVAMVTGTVPIAKSVEIRQALRDSSELVTMEELGPAGPRQAWVVMAHSAVLQDVRALLSLTDFEEVSFPGLSDYPAEELENARDVVARLNAEDEKLKKRAQELAALRYKGAVALLEALRAEKRAVDVRALSLETEKTFIVRGWVPAKATGRLDESLAAVGSSVDVSYRDPEDEEYPPAELDNPVWLRPFEVLTDLYGRPSYREIDPTPLLAPFFWLFFGICIGDVGYGLMLVLVPQLLKRKLDVAPGVQRFMDLLSFGGAAAMLWGVLTASYFAIEARYLPSWLSSLALFDPLQELQTFLLITIGLGLTQVFIGVIVAAYDAARRGDWATALLEQMSTVFFFVSLAVAALVPGAVRPALVLGLGITFLAKGRVWEASAAAADAKPLDRLLGRGMFVVLLGMVAALALGLPGTVLLGLAAAVMIAFVLSGGARRVFAATLGGAYEVYGLSGFIGDVLSYTRLAALGISGFLVGMVFNILGGMVWGGALGMISRGGTGIVLGLVVILLAMLVFVVGHVFNVMINLLGAFVHPARLQFVEFFSKFYEGGGKVYQPFSYESKALVFEPDASRREGGTA